MSGSRTSLEAALLAMLPDARLTGCKRSAWHSATFSGERVVVSLELQGPERDSAAEAFTKILPETEFQLRKQFVADISVSEQHALPGAIALTVEALLLDE
jgi:hypothetical protein